MDYDAYLVSPPCPPAMSSGHSSSSQGYGATAASSTIAGRTYSFSNPMDDWDKLKSGEGVDDDERRQQQQAASSGPLPYMNPQHARSESTFVPMEHTQLSPSWFDPSKFSPAFIAPRFAVGGPRTTSQDGPAIVEPLTVAGLDLTYGGGEQGYVARPNNGGVCPASTYDAGTVPAPVRPMAPKTTSQWQAPAAPTFSTSPPIESPIYDLYGSSVVSVNSHSNAFKLTPTSYPPFAPSSTATAPKVPYNPAALGLPLPPNKAAGPTNWKGLYSSSGFDLLGVLARVAARPNPEVQIGAVDTGCSFLVVDARKWDHPIVYASETFTGLTGYTNQEIVGRNCRFLQSPDGVTAQGSKRAYTDEEAVWNLKKWTSAGKESQTSLINYRKGGRPFINLITIIPITWDSSDIAYFVGFQVDLVDQPTAILEKMKNGTYIVNYSVLAATVPKPFGGTGVADEWEQPSIENVDAEVPMDVESSPVFNVDMELMDKLSKNPKGMIGEATRKQFNNMLLDQCNDLVHVLSLKGSILYASSNLTRILEYEPAELAGKGLLHLCHPSDLVSVLRELRECSVGTHPSISLVYRIRRKYSGFMWIEANGKLHVESGKGRKSVILVGRPHAVLTLSWRDLPLHASKTGYWSKLSSEGMHLYTTPGVLDILGYTSEELVGTRMAQLCPDPLVSDTIRAIAQGSKTAPMTLRHQMNSRHETVNVITRFYPDHKVATDSNKYTGPLHFYLIAHTTFDTPGVYTRPMHGAGGTASSRTTSHSSESSIRSPNYTTASDQSSMSSVPSLGAGSSPRSLQLQLPHPSTISDEVFNELDVARGTNWQFELHQLRLVNKKLREEKERLRMFQLRGRTRVSS